MRCRRACAAAERRKVEGTADAYFHGMDARVMARRPCQAVYALPVGTDVGAET
jgi:hypothetical protein